MKLIIDIHEEQYEFIKQGMSIDKITQFPALMEAICEHITNGIPLDDVKAEIRNSSFDVTEKSSGEQIELNYTVNVLNILDNISKESEVKPNE